MEDNLFNFNKDSIINLIANDNYIIVNRTLIKELGLKEAILLGELASEFNYYKKNNLLDDDGYFYSTIENIQESTSLSAYEQKKCLDNLSKRNIVDVIIKGIPAKRHIKIYSLQLVTLFSNFLETSFQKNKKLDTKKFTTNNNNNNNKENINNIYEEQLYQKPLLQNPISVSEHNKVLNNKVLNNKYIKYGTYGRVKLKQDEYTRLVDEFGKDFINHQIELLDEYIESNNNKNKYTNFNLVLRKSIRENWFNKPNKVVYETI